MKKYLVIIFIFFSSYVSAQQATFNSREYLGGYSLVLSNVLATDSCYYACGLIKDTLNPQSCFLWTKWNLEGEFENSFEICDSIKPYEVFRKTLLEVNNGEFVISGLTSDSIPRNYFMRFNLQGEILSYRSFKNYYYPARVFTVPFDMVEVDQGYIITANGSNDASYPAYSNNFLIKVDEYGEEIWQKAFGTNNCDLGLNILEDQFSEDVYLFSTVSNSCLQNQFLTRHTYIYIINPDGNHTLVKELGTIENPAGWCHSAIQLDDGSLILGTGKGYINDSNVNHQILYDNQVVKLDADLNIEWEQTFATNSKSYNEINDIILTPDNNGIISVGVGVQNGDFWGQRLIAQINKASIEGDSLWARYYQWGNAIGGDQSHSFLDIDLALDGGFICVGNSIDHTIENEPTQQAWIIKLDEHGCLVPDCHLIDTVDAVNDLYLDIDYSVFPNPTSDYINIHYTNDKHTNEGVFKIVNALGQIVYTLKPAFSDIIFLIVMPLHSRALLIQENT